MVLTRGYDIIQRLKDTTPLHNVQIIEQVFDTGHVRWAVTPRVAVKFYTEVTKDFTEEDVEMLEGILDNIHGTLHGVRTQCEDTLLLFPTSSRKYMVVTYDVMVFGGLNHLKAFMMYLQQYMLSLSSSYGDLYKKIRWDTHHQSATLMLPDSEWLASRRDDFRYWIERCCPCTEIGHIVGLKGNHVIFYEQNVQSCHADYPQRISMCQLCISATVNDNDKELSTQMHFATKVLPQYNLPCPPAGGEWSVSMYGMWDPINIHPRQYWPSSVIFKITCESSAAPAIRCPLCSCSHTYQDVYYELFSHGYLHYHCVPSNNIRIYDIINGPLMEPKIALKNIWDARAACAVMNNFLFTADGKTYYIEKEYVNTEGVDVISKTTMPVSELCIDSTGWESLKRLYDDTPVYLYREVNAGGRDKKKAAAAEEDAAAEEEDAEEGGGGKSHKSSIVRKNPFMMWCTDPNRRKYKSIVFEPALAHDYTGPYNLFKGLAVQPKASENPCPKILEHMYKVIANGSRETYTYLIKRDAFQVQNIGKKIGVMVTLQGIEGTGKSLICNVLWRKILGRHHMVITDAKHVYGRFTSHLNENLMLVMNEAFWGGDILHESILKSMITDANHVREGKYEKAVNTKTFSCLMATSNKDWIVPANVDERRYPVFRVSACKKGDTAYFEALADEINKNGPAEYLYYLLYKVNLRGWNPEAFPRTVALLQQILCGNSLLMFFYRCLSESTIWVYYMSDDSPEFKIRTHPWECYSQFSGKLYQYPLSSLFRGYTAWNENHKTMYKEQKYLQLEEFRNVLAGIGFEMQTHHSVLGLPTTVGSGSGSGSSSTSSSPRSPRNMGTQFRTGKGRPAASPNTQMTINASSAMRQKMPLSEQKVNLGTLETARDLFKAYVKFPNLVWEGPDAWVLDMRHAVPATVASSPVDSDSEASPVYPTDAAAAEFEVPVPEEDTDLLPIPGLPEDDDDTDPSLLQFELEF